MSTYINGVKVSYESRKVHYLQITPVDVNVANQEFSQFGTGDGTLTFLANSFAVGTKLRIQYGGSIYTDNIADTSATLRFKLNGVNKLESTAVLARGLVAVPFKLDFSATILSIVGTTATIRSEYTSTIYGVKNSISAVSGRADVFDSTFDITQNQTIDITYMLARANANTHVVECCASVEVLKIIK